MTKHDIVERIAQATGLTRVETEAVVSGFMVVVSDALAEGERIELRGFGVFDVVERAARIARNPTTGEALEVPPRRMPVFRPSRDLKHRVHLSSSDG
jgi:nucleoid DNA-binding protein